MGTRRSWHLKVVHGNKSWENSKEKKWATLLELSSFFPPEKPLWREDSIDQNWTVNWNKTNSNFSLKLTWISWGLATDQWHRVTQNHWEQRTLLTKQSVKLFLCSIGNNYARKLGFPKINQVWVALYALFHNPNFIQLRIMFWIPVTDL